MDFIPEDPILEFLPDTLVAIRKIYNLEDGRMEQSIDILDEWIKKQNHFVNKNFSPEYLERTLIACKGSVEKAKKQIDKLCTYKTLFPKFFICSDVRTMFSEINEKVYGFALPKMTKEYQRIFLLKNSIKEFDSSHFMDFYRLMFVNTEYLKAHDYVYGFIIIQDLRDANVMEMMTKINLTEFQQQATILIEGFGAKMKSTHVITQSKVIDIFVKMVSSLLPPKLAERIHVHPDLEGLHQHVDKDLLPVELGGRERSLQELQDKWMEVLGSEEHEKYLSETKASCTDESLRQTEKFNEQYMNLPGSFRTLTVD